MQSHTAPCSCCTWMVVGTHAAFHTTPWSSMQPHTVTLLEWWWDLCSHPCSPHIVPCSPTQSLYLNGGVNPYSQFNPHSPTCPLQLSHRPTQPRAITLLEWWWGANAAIHAATLVEWWCGPMQPSTQPHTVTLFEWWWGPMQPSTGHPYSYFTWMLVRTHTFIHTAPTLPHPCSYFTRMVVGSHTALTKPLYLNGGRDPCSPPHSPHTATLHEWWWEQCP